VQDDNENRRKWILTGLAVLAAVVTLAFGLRDTETASVSAGAGTTTTEPATDAAPTETEATEPATDDASGDGAAVPLPAEIADDPIVKRLANGRTLPFTAGPWQKEAWRDAVFTRLSAAAQARFEKVPYEGGFGIVIQ
jgi:hypothetical protein